MDIDALGVSTLDDDGFMQDNTDWSPEIARQLAEKNDLGPLTKAHWTIIAFVRRYYAKYHEGPPVVKIAKATGMSSRYICTLFPCGIAKGAYRLAGLPRPSGCL
jgi:tRNA 2-thiouridine synthesizing protein E